MKIISEKNFINDLATVVILLDPFSDLFSVFNRMHSVLLSIIVTYDTMMETENHYNNLWQSGAI